MNVEENGSKVTIEISPLSAKIKFRSDVRADKKIFIEVSNNLLSQVITRAFSILLREVYGYKNIFLYELEYNMSAWQRDSIIYEDYKLEISREYLKTYVLTFHVDHFFGSKVKPFQLYQQGQGGSHEPRCVDTTR